MHVPAALGLPGRRRAHAGGAGTRRNRADRFRRRRARRVGDRPRCAHRKPGKRPSGSSPARASATRPRRWRDESLRPSGDGLEPIGHTAGARLEESEIALAEARGGTTMSELVPFAVRREPVATAAVRVACRRRSAARAWMTRPDVLHVDAAARRRRSRRGTRKSPRLKGREPARFSGASCLHLPRRASSSRSQRAFQLGLASLGGRRRRVRAKDERLALRSSRAEDSRSRRPRSAERRDGIT